jgi:hypothetical protein
MYACANGAVRTKLKLSPNRGHSGSKKCKWRYGGVWRSQLPRKIRSQAVRFVLVLFAGIWLQSPWRCLHIYCNFKVNFISVVISMLFSKTVLQYNALQQRFIPVIYDGWYYISSIMKQISSLKSWYSLSSSINSSPFIEEVTILILSQGHQTG